MALTVARSLKRFNSQLTSHLQQVFADLGLPFYGMSWHLSGVNSDDYRDARNHIKDFDSNSAHLLMVNIKDGVVAQSSSISADKSEQLQQAFAALPSAVRAGVTFETSEDGSCSFRIDPTFINEVDRRVALNAQEKAKSQAVDIAQREQESSVRKNLVTLQCEALVECVFNGSIETHQLVNLLNHFGRGHNFPIIEEHGQIQRLVDNLKDEENQDAIALKKQTLVHGLMRFFALGTELEKIPEESQKEVLESILGGTSVISDLIQRSDVTQISIDRLMHKDFHLTPEYQYIGSEISLAGASVDIGQVLVATVRDIIRGESSKEDKVERGLDTVDASVSLFTSLPLSVAQGLPSGISAFVTLATTEIAYRVKRKKLQSDLKTTKQWLVEEIDRLVTEFEEVKQLLQERIEFIPEGPNQQDTIASIQQAIYDLRDQYQLEIDEVKQATAKTASKLMRTEDERKTKRAISIANTTLGVASNFFPPILLGMAITGGISLGFELFGKASIQRRADATHGVRTDNVLLIDTNLKSIRRALIKSERIAEPSVALMPLVLDPNGSIRKLEQRIANQLERLETRTEQGEEIFAADQFLLKLPHKIKKLKIDASHKEIIKEYTRLQANARWLEQFTQRYKEKYNGKIAPNIANLSLLQNEIKNNLNEIKELIDNKKIFLESTNGKQTRIGQLDNCLTELDQISLKEFLNQPLELTAPEEQDALDNAKKMSLTKFHAINRDMRYLQDLALQLDKPIKNQAAIIEDFRRRIASITEGFDHSNEEHSDAILAAERQQYFLTNEVNALVDGLQRRHPQQHVQRCDTLDAIPGKNSPLKIGTEAGETTQISWPANRRFKKPEDVTVFAKRAVKRIKKIITEEATAQRQINEVFLVPYANFDVKKEGKETLNNLELYHRAKGLFDEVRWADRVRQQLFQETNARVANIPALRDSYKKQCVHLFMRLQELDDPNQHYVSKNRNRLIAKLKTTWNKAKIKLFRRKALRQIQRIGRGLGIANLQSAADQMRLAADNAPQPQQQDVAQDRVFPRRRAASMPRISGPPLGRAALQEAAQEHEPEPLPRPRPRSQGP